jgi:flagellar motility protein MotE (MotC chaperone)
VKKWIIIGAAVPVAGIVFLAALVMIINSRGGLDPSHAGIKKVPVIGALVKVKEPPKAADAKPAEPAPDAAAPAGGDLPFMRFGAQSQLAVLVQELEAKKAEYEALLLQAQRRTRELDAWEKQIAVERDTLRDKLEKEKQDLTAQRQDLDQKTAALATLQLQIKSTEEANLKSTAGIYDKMSPEQAAAILTQMCVAGKQDNVVKIMSLMQDRSAAKTLESFTDPKIGAQITEALQHVAKPAKAGG